MTTKTIDIMGRIKKELKISTDKDLALKIGVSAKRINSWKTRDSMPMEVIIELCLKDHLDLNFILLGKDPCHPLLNHSKTTSIVCPVSDCVIPPEKEIKKHDICNEQIVSIMHIQNSWLTHSLHIKQNNFALILVSGNNMSPWVADGDIVIIDTSKTTIVTDAPFVLDYGDMLVIKRLVRQTDGIIAKSDSPYCENETFKSLEDLPKIIGKVIRRVVR